MNKKTFRIIIGVIWFLVAVLYFTSANYIVALLSVVIGGLFFLGAYKGPRDRE